MEDLMNSSQLSTPISYGSILVSPVDRFKQTMTEAYVAQGLGFHVSEIDENVLASVSNSICLEDVRSALFGIDGLKAPGAVSKAFSSGEVPSNLNHTIIALIIPKVEGPQHMKNFRPISLCNTVYKIIS
ncbi:hypothetical protein OROMI_011793 [Orobanche minor]